MSWNRMLRKAVTIYVVIAICLAGTAMARTIYVNAAVAVSGDGTQGSPYKTIGAAITASAAGDQIWIAGGTYTEEPPYMALKGQQTISGSYDSAFTAADFAATPTIIDMARLSNPEQNRTFRCQNVASFVIENLIIQNSSTGESGNTTNGGAIYIQNGSSGIIRHVSFINCTSKFEGAAVGGPARDGGALCIRDASTVTIEDCVFQDCTAVGNGGAICMRNAGAGNNVKIRRCLFTRCGSRNGASAIHDGDSPSQLEVVNCIFANNGVDVVDSTGTYPSNYEMRIGDKRALVYNCTFVSSNNPDGFMFGFNDSSDAAAVKEIVNCIIANNTIVSGGTAFSLFSYPATYNDTTTIQSNLFFSNSGLDPLDPAAAALLGTKGNIAGDPLFVDAANGDYYLKADSPGVDAGQTLALVLDDFAGTVRPVGAAYDIGALEGQPNAQPTSFKVRNVTATASSSFNADSGPEKTVDGSGLNALSQHDTTAANMWLSATGQTSIWIQYEFDTIYKLDQMWVWNSNNQLEALVGLGVKKATIEYSTDGTTWTALANAPEFAQGTGLADYAHNTTVDFGGVAAKFVKLSVTSSYSDMGQCGLSEVRFFYFAVQARDPKPGNGATNVALNTALTWAAGKEAAEHKVYLSTDLQAVTDGTAPATTVPETSFSPSSLNLATTYYWRVDEVNAAQAISTWPGPVWSFTTASYISVDDMESYNDTTKPVYETWIDGYGTNTNGAQVGNDMAPYMNTTTKKTGAKSMPFRYKISGTYVLSEATRSFATDQDWTASGVKTLRVFFYGNTANTAAGLYVKINTTKISFTGDAASVSKVEWTQWDIPLSSVPAATLKGVTNLTLGAATGTGDLLFDDIALY